MVLHLAILCTVLVTAVLSGVLGMAGGMILMAILAASLPVAAAMSLHGAVQAFSNGSRAWFLREHIRWPLLPRYLVGAACAIAGFVSLGVVPEAGIVLVLVGFMPWFARTLPWFGRHAINAFDGSRPVTAMVAGFSVTLAQLLAGASGPLLDLFYLNTPLSRHQVVATKAVTQTIGHLLKVGYYGSVMIAVGHTLPTWVFAGALLLAILGARIGTWLLDRLDDNRFRQVSSSVILILGVASMVAGVQLLLRA